MTFTVRGMVAGVVLGVLAGAASAQKLTVNPDPLTAGGQAQINYSNTAAAGAVVIILIDGPLFPVPQVAQVAIQLDDSGNGSATWTVPAWPFARFSAFGVSELGRSIAPSGADSN